MLQLGIKPLSAESLTLVFCGLCLLVLVALLYDATALVAGLVAVSLQHVGPRHLAVRGALAPGRLLVAAS